MGGDMEFTSVRHVSKDHIVIAPAQNWTVTFFKIEANAVEALVTDGEETIRLLIQPPGPGRGMTIERSPGGFVDIRYFDE